MFKSRLSSILICLHERASLLTVHVFIKNDRHQCMLEGVRRETGVFECNEGIRLISVDKVSEGFRVV